MDATLNGDDETACKAQEKGDKVSQLYQKDRTLSHSLSAFKVMLSAYRLCQAHVLPPLYQLSAEEEKELKEKTLTIFGDVNKINSI